MFDPFFSFNKTHETAQCMNFKSKAQTKIKYILKLDKLADLNQEISNKKILAFNT